MSMASDTQISIVVNGHPKQVPVGCTVVQLLAEMDLQSPAIAVEINAVICPGAQHESTSLQEADQIEIVSLVGGG